MELFRTVSRRQIFRGLTVAAICLAVIVTAFSGAALPASGRSRRLPVYSVGREEKVISISFDAACPAGQVRKAQTSEMSPRSMRKMTPSFLQGISLRDMLSRP